MFAARLGVMLLVMAGMAYYVHGVSSAIDAGAPRERVDSSACRELRNDYNNARMAERNGYSSAVVDHSASDALESKLNDKNCSLSDPSSNSSQYATYSTPSQVGKPTLNLDH